MTLSTPAEQLKHWRVSIQGNLWLWDIYQDPIEYMLAAETYIEKIYWPIHIGTIFFLFKFSTRYEILVKHYEKRHEDWVAKKGSRTTRHYRAKMN